MKRTTILLLLVMVMISLLGACAVPVSNTADPSTDPSAVSESATPAATETAAEVSETPVATESPAEVSETPEPTPTANNIAKQTKEYLLHGQEDGSEAGKLHWTQPFLDQVDIDAVYGQYLAGGGKADDVADFAEYLTENAPVPDNWKELFEAELKAQGFTPSRYEDLGDNMFQVYVIIDGKEVPYVGVNARTGYFHG